VLICKCREIRCVGPESHQKGEEGLLKKERELEVANMRDICVPAWIWLRRGTEREVMRETSELAGLSTKRH
jgi:hypothetical protein